jgi:transcriptional regulator with XRE-family HTH domain
MEYQELQVETALRIGQEIRRRRKAKKLSLSRLAEQAGLQKGPLSLIERGKRAATIPRLQLIAAALEVPLGDILEPPKRRAK